MQQVLAKLDAKMQPDSSKKLTLVKMLSKLNVASTKSNEQLDDPKFSTGYSKRSA
jgi:hypothetical protein